MTVAVVTKALWDLFQESPAPVSSSSSSSSSCPCLLRALGAKVPAPQLDLRGPAVDGPPQKEVPTVAPEGLLRGGSGLLAVQPVPVALQAGVKKKQQPIKDLSA